MNSTEPNFDFISYDYAKPIQAFESLYGRQTEWSAIKHAIRRPDAGLSLVIGGAHSGKSSLLQVVDDQYRKGLKGQAVETLFPGLTFYCSLQNELTTLGLGAPSAGNASDGDGVIPYDQAALRQMLFQSFDRDELATLAFDMGIRQDELAPGTLDSFITQLITYLDRRGRIQELVNRLQVLRANIDWQVVLGKSQGSPTPANVERLNLGKLCEKLVRGLRENARNVLGVCSIEWHELVYSPVYTPKEYMQQNIRKVIEGCQPKLPSPALKLALLIDDADVLTQQPWRFEFLGAIQRVFEAGLVVLLAGGQPLFVASQQEPAWRSLVQRQIFMNNLTVEDVRLLAEKPRGGQRLPDAFLAEVHRQTGGQPYLTQFFLSNVEAREELIAEPVPERITQAGQELVSQDETLPRLFAEWSNASGQVGRWVYNLIVEAGGSLALNEIVQKMTGLIPATQLEPTMNWLCGLGVIAKTTSSSYSVAGTMFQDWFRANVQKDLTPPQPVRGGPDTKIFG